MKTIELLRFRLSLIFCLSASLGLVAQTPALPSWVPLFEKFDVDLVCEAVGRNIKRTVPIRNGRKDETGVVYIGEGGLGVRQRTPKEDRWYLKKPGMADRGHHVQLLTFTPDKLQYRCVLLGGKVLDRHVLAP